MADTYEFSVNYTSIRLKYKEEEVEEEEEREEKEKEKEELFSCLKFQDKILQGEKSSESLKKVLFSFFYGENI